MENWGNIFWKYVNMLFYLHVHAPDLLHCQLGAHLCLGSGSLGLRIVVREIERKWYSPPSGRPKLGFQVCSKTATLKLKLCQTVKDN